MENQEEIKFRLVYSGSLTRKMHDILLDLKNFKPFDLLFACHEKNEIKKAIKWKHEGFCRWLFCDSGAYSVHTGLKHITQDGYIKYINEVNDDIDVFAQLDTIPGKYRKPKSPEDYVKSAEDSWENFLYMRQHVPDKHKIMPVYHFGEDTKYLKRMLDYVDEDGNKLDYIGLSPANDASIQDRMMYLDDMFKIIKKSSNPNVKTHIYGFTSLEAMSKFPCYSADSITHRLIAGYNKIYTQHFGIVSISKKPRTARTKSNMSFLETADDINMGLLRDELDEWGFTLDLARKYGFEGDNVLDWLSNCNDARVAFNMKTTQKLAYTKYAYHPGNLVRQKRLFNI